MFKDKEMPKVQKGYYSAPDVDEALEYEAVYQEDSNISGMVFLHGVCGIFALALHDVFGYEIGWILDDEKDDDGDFNPWHHLVHVFCHYETKDGDIVYVDIRGSQSDENTFEDPFEDFFVEPRYAFDLSYDDIKANIYMDMSAEEFAVYYEAARYFIRTNAEFYRK